MHKRLGSLRSLTLASAVALACATAALGAIELTFKSGQTWRGDLNETVQVVYLEGGGERTIEGKLLRADKNLVVVEGTVAGKVGKKTIFTGDIRAMKSLAAAAAPATAPAAAASGTATAPAAKPDDKAAAASPTAEGAAQGVHGLPANYKGVFVLPLEGMVGPAFRNEDIKAMGEEADKYGPGQIIVLYIDSGGGSLAEAKEIDETLRDIRKRHRVVAWIREAISAAAFTALHCDEMYFMSVGSMGSMTGFNSGNFQSMQGESLQGWLDLAGRVAEESGRDGNMARCMIRKELECSVDIPEGGGPKDAVWRNDAKGKIVVDTKDTMLCFNASNALAVGVSDGTADSEEELAKLLDLPEWKEASDFGRKLHAKIQNDLKRGDEVIPKLVASYGFKGTGSGDPVVVLGARIGILKELISWWVRCPDCMMNVGVKGVGVPPKEVLEDELKDLQKQLAAARKARDSARGGAGAGN